MNIELLRKKYEPPLPDILKQPLRSIASLPAQNSKLESYFPLTLNFPFLNFEKGESPATPLKVGVVFSGGQAAGGHNVIAGLFDALPPKSHLVGFLEGPSGIVENKWIELTAEKIAPYRNQGGFDLIGSGRTKIETPEQFAASLKAVSDLDGLVIIGGDDSNTNAALLAEYFLANQCKTCVVGVPKTIDGDLRSPDIEIPFGFDTASKIYSEMIGNLLRDSLSAKKYFFFIKIMGRSASHLALECALQTHPNLTLIGEEIASKGLSLKDVIEQITTLVEERSKRGKNYGALLIPEGVLEFIPEFASLIRDLNQILAKGPFDIKALTGQSLDCYQSLPEALQRQLILDRDPHGNVKVSQIETEKLLMDAVQKELQRRGSLAKFSPLPCFYGYEGRCGFPTNFDCQYGNALGHVAALLVKERKTGYMACVKNLTAPVDDWQILGIPLTSLIHLEERKGKQKPVIRKTLVDLTGKPFLEFNKIRERWALEDDYHYPGPIQFHGPKEVTELIPLTLTI